MFNGAGRSGRLKIVWGYEQAFGLKRLALLVILKPEYIYFISLGTLPFTCYIFFDEHNVTF